MTKSPCFNDGNDCPRRHVGCRAECTEWQDWLAKHEQEREKRKKKLYAENDVNGFLSTRRTRIRVREQEQSIKRCKGEIR